MDDEALKENQAQEPVEAEQEPVKRSFIVNKDNPPIFEQRSKNSKLGNKIFVVVAVLLLLFAGGYFIVKQLRVSTKTPGDTGSVNVINPTSLPEPTPTNKPVFDKSDWSLEILNGSGVTGAAKKIAERLQTFGYPVVKTGNADKDNYSQTQIFIKKSLQDRAELIIADLKDIIKIASVAGELQDSTASARIIIGKDSI